ncbi:MAG TPA: aldose 1-epimerase family protein [Solirubrobacteraceae bacterium]|nr:aldose 1-epimerase family protein [Solirubrobacteraceae bacterium]
MAVVTQPPTGAQFELHRGRQRLVVNEIGAGVRSWTVGGHELLASFGPAERDEAFCGRVLVPWPNRVRDGRYAFDGAEHRLELTEPELGNALHGLVLHSRWHGVRTSARRVSLSYELHPRAGYPFALSLAVSYELASGGIVMTLHATNVGAERAPFGAGLHPYLTPGTSHVDDVVLEVPASTHVPVDERLLPSGSATPVDGTELDFRRARRLGGLRLDACFGELGRSQAGVARVRVGTHAGAGQLTVWMDERFRFVQVFTADAAIAVEPMTCAPDAFNSGDGLVVLEPGASFTGRCGLIAAGF